MHTARCAPPALALAILLGGCKEQAKPAPAATPAKAAAQVAKVEPVPVAAPEAGPLEAVPLTDTTLSALEPRDGRCAWQRFDPVADKSATLATFARGCDGGQVAWSPDRGTALVSFGEGRRGEQLELHLVDVAKAKAAPLPQPALEPATTAGRLTVWDLGLNAAGEPVLLFLETLEDATVAKGQVQVDGETLAFNSGLDGIPALAHAVRWRGGKWERFETVATSEGADLSPGVGTLKASHGLGPRTSQILVPRFQGDAVDSKEVLDALAPFAPREPRYEGAWILVGTPAGKAYAWEQGVEMVYVSAPIVFAGEPFVEAPGLGFGPQDAIAVRTEGSWLLVASGAEGRRARLYDVGARRLAWSSDSAREVVFWPREHKPARD